MRFDYRCSMSHITERSFPIGQAKSQMRCPICKNIAKKVILSSPQMVTERWVDKSENRLVPVGHSEKDATEEAKRYDKSYDASFKESPPPKKGKSMTEIGQDIGLWQRSK